MKKQWSSVFLIILILLVAIFAVLNVDPVTINFGFALIELPLAVVLIVTLLIGVIMAVLLSTGV
ncbi:MAG: LapA family protein, partial [Atopostipes suicloacalis]|nr:LapA family protein [Atopostipes suicloacalis]